jgi:hypothetical protein
MTAQHAQPKSPEEYAAYTAQADERLSALAVMAGEPVAGYRPKSSRRIEELLTYARQKESASVWDYELSA